MILPRKNETTTENAINSRHAIDFANGRISVCPLVCDGSKRPLVSWTQYQRQIATESVIRDWYTNNQKIGTAVICGAVSGGLEVLDFDQDAFRVFTGWASLVDPILCRMPVVETPSGGYHVYYRCNVICGNQKIAMPADSGKPYIESRGEGGYVVTVISPAEVHSKNYPYIQVAGPVLPEVPRVTPDERKALWAAAATFDRSKLRETEIKKLIAKKQNRCPGAPKSTGTDKLTPWDDYNSRGDWFEVLNRHDWTTTDGIHWRHPKASFGHNHSATLRQAESGDMVLRVFTTSTALDADKSHSLFSFAMVMDYNGDSSTAATAIRRQGYGK